MRRRRKSGVKGCGATCHGAMCQSIRHVEQPRTCLAATPSPPLPNKSLCWRKPEALNLSRSLFFFPLLLQAALRFITAPPGAASQPGGAPQGARIEQKLQPEGIRSPSSPDPSARPALTLPPGPALAWIFSFSPPGPRSGAPHAAGRGPSRRAAPRRWPPSLLPSLPAALRIPER